MTMSLDPFNTSSINPDGSLRHAPSGIHFHFHAPVTINLQAPGGLVDEGGDDEDLPERPSVIAPLVCTETQALPATHPNNDKPARTPQWTIPERYPHLIPKGDERPDDDADEDEESAPRWWQRKRVAG